MPEDKDEKKKKFAFRSYTSKHYELKEKDGRQILATITDTYGTYDAAYRRRIDEAISSVTLRKMSKIRYTCFKCYNVKKTYHLHCEADKMDCVDEVKFILNFPLSEILK